MDSSSDEDFARVPFVAPAEPAEIPVAPGSPRARDPDGNIVGGPSTRTPMQHHWLCGRAREAKAKVRSMRNDNLMLDTAKHMTSARKKTTAHLPVARNSKRCFRRELEHIASTSSSSSRGSRRLTKEEDVDIGFCRGLLLDSVAKEYKVAPGIVSETRATIADTWLIESLEQLQSWEYVCSRQPPFGALHGRMYDSAKFKARNPITLPVLGEVRG